MPSASKAAKSRGENSVLLKGSDLKKSELQIVVFCKGVREAPKDWGSPLVMDIEETHGARAFAVNKTNSNKLVELIADDYEEWTGYEITMEKVRVPNPSQGGALVDSLSVVAAKKSKRKAPF